MRIKRTYIKSTKNKNREIIKATYEEKKLPLSIQDKE